MNWLMPADPKIYDLAASFKENGYIDWHQYQKANFSIGDIVYIYCTKPIKAIRFKTRVIKTGLKFNEVTHDKKFWYDLTKYKEVKYDKYCRLSLISGVDNDKLSLQFLTDNGLTSAPRGPQKIKSELNDYIARILQEAEVVSQEEAAEQFDEGGQQIKQHKVRGRSKELVRAVKQKFRQEHFGKLFCEICGFDFSEFYGDIGEDCIEVHHKKPISTMKKGERTDIKDMAIVCSNCHRIIHIKKPCLTVEQLKGLIRTTKKQ
ncbi:MAG: HNH endonuclease [Treponemataceae bacterium]|nr:HNH endonuclease [Treponemataceae bacterium]